MKRVVKPTSMRVLLCWGLIAGVVLVVGLSIGFSHKTISTADTTAVDCGSAFAPAAAPTGDVVGKAWSEALGYEYKPNGLFEDTPELLHSLCGTYLTNNRILGLLLTVPGALGVLFTGLYAHLAAGAATARRRRVLDRSQETYWRSQGYVPAAEVPTPPAGWLLAPGSHLPPVPPPSLPDRSNHSR